MDDIKGSLLFKFVQQKSAPYYEELVKLRTHTERWISNINTTFSHYPSHGIDHSDEIIRNMSKILFKKADINQPVAKEFNEIEASILIAAAYTHDIGMVVSDEEKLKITKTDAWAQFLENNEEAKNCWEKTRALVSDSESSVNTSNESERLFLASVSQRHLFAEFFRKSHAKRSGVLLHFDPAVFGADFLQDRQFRDAVAKVGEGHGISYTDLENTHRYSEANIIKEKAVNIRFLAIIMRFGDLLDMRAERSNSTYKNLTLIPESSVPHWDQYEDFRDECITHETISFTAYCPTQDSYRTLRHWCCWIEEESKLATESMRRSERHADWLAPRAKVAAAKGEAQQTDTIIIKPSVHANFEPLDWKFYFNKTAIIQRLTTDIYRGDKLVFLRELIQNSLDATRARLVARLNEDEIEIPAFLNDVPEHERNKFPISISLETRAQDDEQNQWVVIEDKGIGMNTHIIQNYFLQVGQSFYTTNEFKGEYHFSPTRRFGVGFLSVFGVSNHIEITTHKGMQKGQPLKLTLNNPTDYLLTEKLAHKVGSGTKIEIRLTDKIGDETFARYVRNIVGRSEFPIKITVAENCKNIYPKQFESVTIPIRDASGEYQEDASFEFKVYDLKDNDQVGQLGIWFLNEGSSSTLNYKISLLQDSIKYSNVNYQSDVFFHGLSLNNSSRVSYHRNSRYESWVDYRGSEIQINISRTRADINTSFITSKIHEIINDEIQSANYSPMELHRVLMDFPELSLINGLKDLPLIEAYLEGEKKYISINKICNESEFYIIFDEDTYKKTYSDIKNNECNYLDRCPENNKLVLLYADLRLYVNELNSIWSQAYNPIFVTNLNKKTYRAAHLFKYSNSSCNDWMYQKVGQSYEFKINLPELGNRYNSKIINILHPFGNWLYMTKNSSDLSAEDKTKIESTFEWEKASIDEILKLGKLGVLNETISPPSVLDEPWSQF